MVTDELIKARNDFGTLSELCEPLKSSKLKKMIDFLQRQVYLAEQFSGGAYTCPLTNERLRSHEEVDVCHYIDRGHMSTRWDDDNCVLCSRRSNRVDANLYSETSRSKHHEDFEKFLGENTVNDLKRRREEIIPLSRTDYVIRLQSYLNRLHG